MAIREQSIDLLKGIAVVLMIQVHIIELFATNEIFIGKLGKLFLFLGGAPVAPLFMIILGYFLTASKKTTKQLLLRGLVLFCLGLILNVLLNLNLIYSVINGLYVVDLLPYIFGVDILLFAGLSTLLIVVLRKLLTSSLLLVLILIIVSAFLGHFLADYAPETSGLKYLSAFFFGSAKWSYFPLFPWLTYPLVGLMFYQLQITYHWNKSITKKNKLIIAAVFLLFLLLTFQYAVSISSNLILYYHHGLLFCIWVILFLTFYSFFIHEMNKAIGNSLVLNYLKWLGKNVTAIYIIQWLIIGNIATELYKTVSSPWHLTGYFFSVLLVSSITIYFWNKLKLVVTV